MLPSHDRFKYSGIKGRPKFAWPGNKRLAVYIAVNIEHFPYGVQCGVDLDRQLAGNVPGIGVSASGA